MELPTTIHLKATKKILPYIRGQVNFGLIYSSNNNLNLVGNSDSDWAKDLVDRKSTTRFVLYIGETAFTWSSKKQPIVTLSTCEAEHVTAKNFIYIYIYNVRKKLSNIGQSKHLISPFSYSIQNILRSWLNLDFKCE